MGDETGAGVGDRVDECTTSVETDDASIVMAVPRLVSRVDSKVAPKSFSVKSVAASDADVNVDDSKVKPTPKETAQA